MKEIKFRQRVGTSFHYWGYIGGCFVGPITNCEPNPRNDQYTGLKDYNGVDIYEGDVVRAKTSETPVLEIFGSVIFDDGEYLVEQNDNTFPLCSFSVVSRLSIDVFGNIHENPELLEK